ncbi:MAG: hypothetical protein R3B13_38665 [Polyangiaceae bacterium]
MNKLGWVVMTGVCVAFAGCSSNTEGNGSGGSAGAAGSGATSSGGSAGSGAAAGSAGSSGTAGSAGSGGAAGSSGAAGNAGAAGSGGGTQANARCAELCSAIVGANCSGGPTSAGCLVTCKTLTSSANCDTAGLKYMDCVKANGVQCNGAGDPVSQGCGLDYLAAIGCAVKEDPNPAVVTPCATYCGKVVATSCPNSANESDCNTNCRWAGATGTGCDDEWGAYLTCANAATFSCVLGFAVPQGCGSAFTTYSKCVNNAGN